MKICIPIKQTAPSGGFQFLNLFKGHLENEGWEVTDRLGDKYDILFANSWHVTRDRILKGLRSNGNARVVHRIDGIAAAYGRHDDADNRQKRANKLADLSIFQSNYSRKIAIDDYGVISVDGPVIPNPVDVNRFTPEGDKMPLHGKRRVACVTWSTNPMKGSGRIYDVARRNGETDFYLCGNYPDKPDLPNLHAMGVLERDELAGVLRSCHVLLTFSKNEACPNHVLEGLASGLPVLFEDSGATLELVGDCGQPVTVETFDARLDETMNDLGGLSLNARNRAVEKFHPDIIFQKYLNEIKGVLQNRNDKERKKRAFLAWSDLAFSPLRVISKFAG